MVPGIPALAQHTLNRAVCLCMPSPGGPSGSAAFVMRFVPWPQPVCSDRKGRRGGGKGVMRSSVLSFVVSDSDACFQEFLQRAEVAPHRGLDLLDREWADQPHQR